MSDKPLSRASHSINLRSDLENIPTCARTIIEKAKQIKGGGSRTTALCDITNCAKALLHLHANSEDSLCEVTKSLPGCSTYAIKRLSVAKKLENQLGKNQKVTHNLRTRLLQYEGTFFPMPSHSIYTADEACRIIVQMKGGKARGLVDRLILEKFIPVKRTRMYELLTCFKNGQHVTWKSCGAVPILTDKDFDRELKKHKGNNGQAVSKNDVKTILKDELITKARARNMSTLTVVSPTWKTVRNYFNYALAKHPGLSDVEKVQQKSEARFTAERSLRGTMTYLCCVASTHYELGTCDPRIADIKEATEGAQLLNKLVREGNGGEEIRPILPWHITSTDDTTIFAFEGMTTTSKKIYLVDKYSDRSTRSSYTQDNGGTTHLCGMRVRHTVTINAAGNVANIWLTVYGLTEIELSVEKAPDGLFLLPVEGLCYGAEQNVDNKTMGYVMFMRSSKNSCEKESNDQKNHERYKEVVLDKFIKDVRANYSQDKWTCKKPVEENMQWVAWMDGHGPGLKSVIKETNLARDEINRITTCKHASSTTATTQACGVGPQFRLVKSYCKSTTEKKHPLLG